jgi:hypothetical protein
MLRRKSIPNFGLGHIYKTIPPLFYPLWAREASNLKKGIKGQKKSFGSKNRWV